MTLADYGSLAEIIGVIGMIASLIYVGYQLQQARVQMKGQASQARADAYIDLWSGYQRSDFAKLVHKSQDPESLTPVEQIQLTGFVLPFFSFMQNVHYQRELGLLEKGQAIFLDTLPAFLSDSYRKMWSRFKSGYSPDFISHVESVIARQDAEGDQQALSRTGFLFD